MSVKRRSSDLVLRWLYIGCVCTVVPGHAAASEKSAIGPDTPVWAFFTPEPLLSRLSPFSLLHFAPSFRSTLILYLDIPTPTPRTN